MYRKTISTSQIERRLFNSKKNRHFERPKKLRRTILESNRKSEDDPASVTVVLRPVFIIGRFIGFPFEVKFRWLSLRTLRLGFVISFATTLTLLVIHQNVSNLQFASLGAISFYFLATSYLCYFTWTALQWGELRENWVSLEKKMSDFPRARVNATVSSITLTFLIVGLCEHLFSILDNLRRVITFCKEVDKSSLELYYLVHYNAIFQFVDYAVWKGALTSICILLLTVTWTFSDIFTMTVSVALAARYQELRLALTQVKDKEMPQRFWKRAREIYLELSFLTKELDDKISLLIFISLGNNVYSVIIMLLNALSLKTNKDFLQTTYYLLTVSFVSMRLIGVCHCSAKISEQSKGLLPLLFAVPSRSYCLEVHRFVMHVWYEPQALSAFHFFSITRSTVLKIAGSILTYEIVLIQFKYLDAEEEVRRPKAECPYNMEVQANETLGNENMNKYF